MISEVEVFAINASRGNKGLFNRWVAYNIENSYEVYLETTKENKILKAHASTFKSQDEAIEFIAKMNRLCTNGRNLHTDNCESKQKNFNNLCNI